MRSFKKKFSLLLAVIMVLTILPLADVMVQAKLVGHIITNSGSGFLVDGNVDESGQPYTTLSAALLSCTGAGAVFQFGDGNTELTVPTVTFSTGNSLPSATYTGKVKSSGNNEFLFGVAEGHEVVFNNIEISCTSEYISSIGAKAKAVVVDGNSSANSKLTIEGDSTQIVSTAETSTGVLNNEYGIVDIKGGTISSSMSAASRAVENTGTLNISGGTIKAVFAQATGILNFGTLNMSGGTIEVDGIGAEGINNNNIMNMTGGTVKVGLATGYAAAVSNWATAGISGGQILSPDTNTDAYAINQISGALNISGSALLSAGNHTIYTHNGSTANITGGTVESTNPDGNTINIYDGSVNVNTEGKVLSKSQKAIIFGRYAEDDTARMEVYGVSVYSKIDYEIYVTGLRNPSTGYYEISSMNGEYGIDKATVDVELDSCMQLDKWTSDQARQTAVAGSACPMTIGANTAFYLSVTIRQPIIEQGQAILQGGTINLTPFGNLYNHKLQISRNGSDFINLSYEEDQTTVEIPEEIEDGTYRVYLYRTSDGTRSAGSINSFTVGASALTDSQAVALCKADLNNFKPPVTGVGVNSYTLQFPTSGSNGTTLSWAETEDNGSIFNLTGNKGILLQPSSKQGGQKLIYTVTISRNGVSDTKAFTLNVPPTDEAPANLKVSDRGDGSINVEDDNLYLSFDAAQDWLQKLSEIVITKDGGSNTEGVDKWTVAADKVFYRTTQTDSYDTALYDGCSNYELLNQDLFVKLQLGTANRICKTGNYTVKIISNGYDQATAGFAITYGSLSGIKVTDQPSNVASGGMVGTVKVALTDMYGNTVINSSGGILSVVTASAKESAFTIGGTTTATIADGIASFSGITASKAEGLTGAKLHFSVTRTVSGGDAMINGNGPGVLASADTAAHEEYSSVNDFGSVNNWEHLIPLLYAGAGGGTKTFTCESEAFNISAAAANNGTGSGSTQGSAGTAISTGSTEIIVNGQRNNGIASSNTETATDGKTTKTVTLDENKLKDILDRFTGNGVNQGSGDASAPVISIPVTGNNDAVVGELTGQSVKAMEQKEAVLEIRTDNITYTLPASQINIDAISTQAGNGVSLSDIKVKVTIAEPQAGTVKVIENTAAKNSLQLVVKPVEFSISCAYGNKKVEVSKFNGYVERTVAIPDGVDPKKITTGIVLNADGTFSHVPTQIITINGKYYAKINSLTNSIYSVIWNPVIYKDAENSWAKEAINDMGSRMVVSGMNDDRFEPERDITRAEFASIIVKALGLLRSGTGKQTFKDISKGTWYYDAISIANEYGIVKGIGNGRFEPAEKITREQAILMIARAMKITKLEVEFKDGEAESLLAAFGDCDRSAAWAKESIAACIKSKIMSGREGKLIAPKENINRAEVAVMIRRLLQKSKLI